MKSARRPPVLPLYVLALLALPAIARPATYLPLSDEELALRAPVIVRARVSGQETRIAGTDGQEVVLTETRLEALEVLKGRMPSETFSVEFPGGEAGELSYRVPGTPSFAVDGEVILFLAPSGPAEDRFVLTEFALSKFDIVPGPTGRRFAVRTAFRAEEDDILAKREIVVPAGVGRRHPLRDAESFAASLRSVGSGADFLPVLYASPEGEDRVPQSASPSWVNLGGTEGTNRLYRWFWDTGRSSAARVTAVGAQTGLSDGSDGLSAVENAALQWAGVAGADVRYSPANGPAQVVVNLDVTSHSSYWSEPMPCTSGGIIGLGGPGAASSTGSFKGDANYSAVTSGTVWMRKITGGCYSSKTFRTAVLHEVGHTLGLGHSDQAASLHSTAAASEASSAVMASVIPYSTPSAPQADDIQAILWLYGTGEVRAPDLRPKPLLRAPLSPRLPMKVSPR
jgi:dual-action HEIGH metallo-peptidase